MPRSHRSRHSVKTQWNLDRRSKQCERKEAFATESDAVERIEGLRKAGKARETMAWILHPYVCKCGAWHVGHHVPEGL